MPQLAALFAITALLYASVGFGGGSTYNALLVLHGTDYRILPAIALLCNIIVVAGGTWRFVRGGRIDWRRVWPWFVLSIPAAWLGGFVPVSESLFIGLLGGALLVAGGQLVFERQRVVAAGEERRVAPALAVGIGGGLGFLAGLVGIGGGIFLAPILYLLRWGEPRAIAALCSLFILVNSLAGLAGQVGKLGQHEVATIAYDYWLLFPAVLIGGQIGSRLATDKLPPLLIKRMTALLILYVAMRLLWRWYRIVG